MFFLLPLLASQVPTFSISQQINQPQEVRPLPGGLDQIPVFNSNSPEIIQKEGILLSTFPPDGKQVPTAHLKYAFNGRFDLFAHHIARAKTKVGARTLYQGLILSNPTSRPVKILVLQANSFLTKNAPFVALPSSKEDTRNRVYAGPGSRTTGDALRRERGLDLPVSIRLEPGETKMLTSLPIPAGGGGRSTLMRLWSDGGVYIASLALYGRRNPNGKERVPTLAEWQALLTNGSLAAPRDLAPTPLGVKTEKLIYGRVAGVSQGAEWKTVITDSPKVNFFSIPKPGQAISYVISSLDNGTLGTGQIQSAPMLVRYPDTAYRAHGNYGVSYDLTLPMSNPSDRAQQVSLMLQTPVKQDQLSRSGLLFLNPPERKVFFRGTVRLQYKDDQEREQIRYFHLVQLRGQQGQPLVTLNLAPQTQRSVHVEFVYPPDSVPPQVLTIKTSSSNTVGVGTDFSRPKFADVLKFGGILNLLDFVNQG
jgi:hypothetical protein